LLFISAAIIGVSAAFGVFEVPKNLRGMPESKDRIDPALLFLGSASALLGIFQFLFYEKPPQKCVAEVFRSGGYPDLRGSFRRRVDKVYGL
jgi:hypothetical protein